MKKQITLALSSTALIMAAATGVNATPSHGDHALRLTKIQTESTPSFSDSDLKNYVAATRKIVVINKDYAQKVQTAQSQAEQHILIQQADQDMIRAVRSEGISVNKYLEITETAQDDVTLSNRIEALLN